MPPRKDFKSPKDVGSNNSSSSATMAAKTKTKAAAAAAATAAAQAVSATAIASSTSNTDLLAPDEKITLPMIDNDTQSTMKQVRTNQRITHRPARIVLFGLILPHRHTHITDTSLARCIKMKCMSLVTLMVRCGGGSGGGDAIDGTWELYNMCRSGMLQVYLTTSKIRHDKFRHSDVNEAI